MITIFTLKGLEIGEKARKFYIYILSSKDTELKKIFTKILIRENVADHRKYSPRIFTLPEMNDQRENSHELLSETRRVEAWTFISRN